MLWFRNFQADIFSSSFSPTLQSKAGVGTGPVCPLLEVFLSKVWIFPILFYKLRLSDLCGWTVFLHWWFFYARTKNYWPYSLKWLFWCNHPVKVYTPELDSWPTQLYSRPLFQVSSQYRFNFGCSLWSAEELWCRFVSCKILLLILESLFEAQFIVELCVHRSALWLFFWLFKISGVGIVIFGFGLFTLLLLPEISLPIRRPSGTKSYIGHYLL